MEDWEKRLNSFIEMFEYGLLKDAGKVSAEIAKLHAETEFEKYRIIQDNLFVRATAFDDGEKRLLLLQLIFVLWGRIILFDAVSLYNFFLLLLC